MRRAPLSDIRIDTLRDAVAVRLETTSLRETARQIGLSPSGLSKFVTGSTPYPKTVRKLRSWYRLYVAKAEEVSAADVERALETMVLALPVRDRAQVRKRLILVLRDGWEPNVPPWLRAESLR